MTRRGPTGALPGARPATALMGRCFTKHQWLADEALDRAEKVQSRMVRAVGVMDDVLLADLTAPGVMAGYFGLNRNSWPAATTRTQQVSAQGACDASEMTARCCSTVLYPSRNNYPAKSIALFERCQRARSELSSRDIDLVDHVDWPRFVATYRIGVEPDPGPLEPDDRSVLKRQREHEHIEALNRMKWTKLK